MFPSPSKLLFGATVAATALFDLAQAGGCDNGPWTGVHAIGETHPDPNKMVPFCATLWDSGIPITGLDVWYDEAEGINAVAVSYSNGDKSAPYGVPGSSPGYQSFTWDYSQTFIESLSLWGNGGGGQLGNIRLVLTDGRTLDVGNRKDTRSKKTEFVIDVASGIMLGFGGWGADNIKQGYFLFLRSQIDRIEMTNPVFDDSPENLNAEQRGLQTVMLDYSDHLNANEGANETFTFANQIQKTDSTTTTSQITHTFGTKITIGWEAKLLTFDLKNSLELSYQYSDQRSEAVTTQTQVQVSWSAATTLKPGQHVYCRATAMYGQADLGYTATINVLLKDGSSWSFSEHGTYSQVAWSQASSVCQDHDFLQSEKQQLPANKRAVKFIA